jgi:aldose 1-epimerase
VRHAWTRAALYFPVSHLRRQPFGALDGRAVELFTLANRNAIEVRAISYGGIITSITTPDRHGIVLDIVLGCNALDGYAGDHPYFGAIVGRYGNRIANGRFSIDGIKYQLATNDGAHHLHGGIDGFDKKIWNAEPSPDGRSVVFAYSSAHGEEGYPGTLNASVRYEVTDADQLIIEYQATTDAPTHVNLTQHSYFNLAGEGNGAVLGHEVSIDADYYIPVDRSLIPTGAIAPVDGTRFDFREPKAIGGGFDHNWVLNQRSSGLRPVARVVEPRSGRTLQVATTEPGLQFYTGNSLDGTLPGKSGRSYEKYGGFCLETQHFPDSPNHSEFPSTLLRPGRTYKSTTIYTFGISK